MFGVGESQSISLEAGHSYYVELTGSMGTLNWGGLEIISNSIPATESRFPITTPTTITSSAILRPALPGSNFVDGHHYYAMMFPNEFNGNNVLDVEAADFLPDGLFSQANFPIFYPNYLSLADNPDATFADWDTIFLLGQNFTSKKVILANNIEMHVLKYEESPGVYSPLFLVKLEPATCFTGINCLSEFMLPVSNKDYNTFILSDLPQYTYRVWIDGVETTYFPQTGLPHELTFEVSDVFTGSLASGVKVFVGEENGQNLFIPYRLSGYITEAFSVGNTDVAGMEKFIVTPTKYGEIDDYKIHYGVFFGQSVTSPRDLNITSSDTLVQEKKSFTQPGLENNLKVAVNAMNSLSDYLYRWADSNTALMWGVNYDLSGSSFTTYDDGAPGVITLKTGAVNVINVNVLSGGVPQTGYFARVKEADGYLIMNPYTGSAPLTQKVRSHIQRVPTPAQLIITPTTYNDVASTITIEILDSNQAVVDTIQLSIDSELGNPTGSFFTNNLLKTISVSMKQILSSVYYSLN